MRGFLIFNTLNDVIFKKLDKELSHHIIGVASKNGFGQGSDEDQGEQDTASNDILMQLFSPLITSQKVLQGKMNNMYTSIYCSDETLAVFTEYLGYTILGINSSKNDSEPVAQKRLHVFVNLLRRLYGPSLHVLRAHVAAKDRRSTLLSELMDAYDHLQKEEQMFLVEAIEHVIISSSVTTACNKLLQSVLEKIRRYSRNRETASHAFMLVNYKLVSTFSSRNATQLSKADLLILLLVLRVLYLENGLITPKDKDRPEDNTNPELRHSLLFFTTKLNSCMPYMVHSLKVANGVILVVVSEIDKSLLADNLFSLMKQLHLIQQGGEEGRSKFTVDTLDSSIDRLVDISRRLELKNDQETFISTFPKKWMHVKMTGLAEYLSGSENEELISRTEEAISVLQGTLQQVFDEIVYKPELIHEKEPRARLQSVMTEVQVMVQNKLVDYLDYLLVKGGHNMTIASFQQEFSGLVHFVYINRSTNFMVSPSLSGSDVKDLKEKVWKSWEFAQKYAHEGSFTTMWSEGDFQFSYFLWFENLSGRPVKPKCAVSAQNLLSMCNPGVLAGNFYRQLMRYCFPDVSLDQLLCLEILCIHTDNTPAVSIIEQSHRLSTALWEVWDSSALELD